jgi:hypothetical protein
MDYYATSGFKSLFQKKILTSYLSGSFQIIPIIQWGSFKHPSNHYTLSDGWAGHSFCHMRPMETETASRTKQPQIRTVAWNIFCCSTYIIGTTLKISIMCWSSSWNSSKLPFSSSTMWGFQSHTMKLGVWPTNHK